MNCGSETAPANPFCSAYKSLQGRHAERQKINKVVWGLGTWRNTVLSLLSCTVS